MLDKFIDHIDKWYPLYAAAIGAVTLIVLFCFGCSIGIHTSDSNYCGYCGQYLENDSSDCSVCGAYVGDYDFCRNCGNPAAG